MVRLKKLTTITISGLALAFLLLGLAANASATPSTVTFHDLVSTFTVPPLTCPDGSTIPGGTVTQTANGVIHFNTDSNGGLHFTMTATGPFTLTATTNGVDYAGQITAWDGGNAHVTSTGASEFGATLNVHATGTDGSGIGFHIDAHVTVNPDGTVTVNNFHLHC
jgi:hypothetical protein